MPASFGVVDLFAGPGGLGEGFASLSVANGSPFEIGISVEKEASAHQTLTLRAFLRAYKNIHGHLPPEYIRFHAGEIPLPDWRKVDPKCWKKATNVARQLELGTEEAAAALDEAISKLRRKYGDNTVLIGGPPCQAYSLVGRARSRAKKDYVPEEDKRHFLFREYIRVLDKLRPAAFVMENVKGILSSKIESRHIFDMIMNDLTSLGTGGKRHYELRAIHVVDGKATLQAEQEASDFVVHAEAFGVPQRRHRVIIIGIRSDLADKASAAFINVPDKMRTVKDAIGNLPHLRSGLSRGKDNEDAWRETVVEAGRQLADIRSYSDLLLTPVFSELSQKLNTADLPPRSSKALPKKYGKSKDDLLQWLERPELHALAQHETRGHMKSDLGRYMFSAVFGKNFGNSPKADDFPKAISPNHKNWFSGIFNDRFRVQLENQPSTTVTCHISKDGHYFIHPDPEQCRSLTVREAARLQTFPDDYLFMGNRTQQYVQVGNAVPPYLARQIARLVYKVIC